MRIKREMAYSVREREAQEELYTSAKQAHQEPKAKTVSSFTAIASDKPDAGLRRELL